MEDDGLPFYRTLTFKFLASAALFIVLIESILLVLSIQGMEQRLLSIRNLVLRNLEGPTVRAEHILSDETIQSIIHEYTRNIIVMVGTIVTVVLGGLYVVVQYWFIDPIRTIVEKNRKTRGRNSLLLIDEENIPNDEIGTIMQSRNEMLTTIQTLYNEEALETLREAVDAKDEYTEGHSRRVGQVASVLGERLDLGPETCEQLQYAGLLHDVGKIAVDEAILTKEGSLTDEEFSEIQTHPARGEKIIQFSSIDERVLNGVRHHHEQYDGSGYPDGLEGDEIPLFGRVLAVADAMDAMLSDRHYRNALDWDEVESELADNRGTQFDPEVADRALELVQPNNRNLLPAFYN
jgi:response regulator RpfG family c-di-GMP phosphodiesterase